VLLLQWFLLQISDVLMPQQEIIVNLGEAMNRRFAAQSTSCRSRAGFGPRLILGHWLL